MQQNNLAHQNGIGGAPTTKIGSGGAYKLTAAARRARAGLYIKVPSWSNYSLIPVSGLYSWIHRASSGGSTPGRAMEHALAEVPPPWQSEVVA